MCFVSFYDVFPYDLNPERWVHGYLIARKINFLSKAKYLYSPPNIIRVIKSRRMRWEGHVARMGEKRGAYRILVGRPEGRRPLGRPRRRWEDNIKMVLEEVEWGHGLD
jgi:hypothetical protein